MPERNRVDPLGRLIRTPARGAWMGNRGCLHDDAGAIVRESSSASWLCCRLDFKGRKRAIKPPGRYTALFFLDEATALAAGHRPCFECRRGDALAFAAAWGAANGAAKAGEMDKRLSAERRGRRGARLVPLARTHLPDGAMVMGIGADPEDFYVVRGHRAWRWTPGGYEGSLPLAGGAAVLVTPPSILAALRQGYRPQIDGTAVTASR
jgi:hypothetical protein